MNIEVFELPDFIVKVVDKELYAAWGRMNGLYGSYGKWLLTDESHRGYPFTKQEAYDFIPEVKKEYPDHNYEVVPRIKSFVSITKI